MYLDPRELNALSAFAGRGGIGKGVALTDCVAESPDQLMYIKGDELVLLRDLGNVMLASCEGVVGWVERDHVEFGQLASTSTPSSELDVRKRVSGPFELESPRIESEGEFFADKQTLSKSVQSEGAEDHDIGGQRDSLASAASSEAFGGIGGFMMGREDSEGEEANDVVAGGTSDIDFGRMTRSSVVYLHQGSIPTPPLESISDHSSVTHTRDHSNAQTQATSSPVSSVPDIEPVDQSEDEEKDWDEEDDTEWDIYGDYARESMYAPAMRQSIAFQQRRASRMAKAMSRLGMGGGAGASAGPDPPIDQQGAVNAARAALEGGRKGPPPVLDLKLGKDRETINGEGEPTTPKLAPPSPKTPINFTSPILQDTLLPGRSVAQEIRLRLQKEREKKALASGLEEQVYKREEGAGEKDGEVIALSPAPFVLAPPAFEITSESLVESPPQDSEGVHPIDAESVPPEHDDSSEKSEPSEKSQQEHSFESPQSKQDSDESTVLATPHPTSTVTFTAASPPDKDQSTLLASPIPLDETDPRPLSDSPEMQSEELLPPQRIYPASNSNLSPRMSPSHSPTPNMRWSPSSPSSPHSVTATKQAVEAVRSTPTGKRPRGLTLVGRMEADLSAAKGPVPITFLVGGPELGPTMPSTPKDASSIGLGLPSGPSTGRLSPSPLGTGEPQRRASSPLSPSFPGEIDDSSRFPLPPVPKRTHTVPNPGQITQPLQPDNSPKPGFFPNRPRSRSFSAAFAKSFVGNKKEEMPPPPPLTVNTSMSPSTVIAATPQPVLKKGLFGKKTPTALNITPPPASPVPSSIIMHSPVGSASLPPPSARSSSFSFTSGAKSRKVSRGIPLPSPISHKDFLEETIKQDGMDFELVQPVSASEFPRRPTLASVDSSSSLKALPETDEWGFLKDISPTPEIYRNRAAAGDHRTTEQKWLAIIATPLQPGTTPPRKVRKLVLETGIPASLRGKVWAWFMAGSMSARTPGLYQDLLSHDKGLEDERIDRDVASAYCDHSIFSSPSSPGQQDLRSLLRAYSNFAPSGYRSEMAAIAGALLIHCVVEDAFWLLAGLVNGVLKDYYAKEKWGLKVDSEVFAKVLLGSEPKLGKLFKEVKIERPRFLLVIALTILTLSRERLLALPKNHDAIMEYLRNIPQDSLLLPENFMRACGEVRFREEDLKKMRLTVDKELRDAL
ncbi:hypothetical protein P7C73_g2277, partial [Tremellales sp. Uapishka_1]